MKAEVVETVTSSVVVTMTEDEARALYGSLPSAVMTNTIANFRRSLFVALGLPTVYV